VRARICEAGKAEEALQQNVARGRRDLAAILGPVLLKPHASRRCLIADGRFNTGALLASTRIFGSLVAGARYMSRLPSCDCRWRLLAG
jgi:hypothetical protein